MTFGRDTDVRLQEMQEHKHKDAVKHAVQQEAAPDSSALQEVRLDRDRED
jgi:hypothetical protein